ncbi:hypothetical protein ACFVJH_38300, partial [Streptomyces decoyicus]|uniref:hypothetical protein n=1 Tax=Streptomyces decoyicus TaxID=249567 RepID=UPI00362EA543
STEPLSTVQGPMDCPAVSALKEFAGAVGYSKLPSRAALAHHRADGDQPGPAAGTAPAASGG